MREVDPSSSAQHQGQVDLVAGNPGNATSPAFVQRTSSLNPFQGVDVGSFSVPSFADLDGDGDLDAFSGELNGTIKYFENITLSKILNLPLMLR